MKKEKRAALDAVTVWIQLTPVACFSVSFFFFFMYINSNFIWIYGIKDKNHYLYTVFNTVYIKKIKNKIYNIIYIFKNYFIKCFQFLLSIQINT